MLALLIGAAVLLAILVGLLLLTAEPDYDDGWANHL